MYVDKAKGLISARDYFEMSEGFKADKDKFEGMIQTCVAQIADIDARIKIGDNRTELIAQYVELDHLTRTMTEILIDHIEIGKRNKDTGQVPVAIYWNF